MVHASLRAVGPVNGGAAGVLEAIFDVLGPEGTLLMLLCADDTHPFDAQTTKVDTREMGVLAEVFRTFPEVQVNDHPAARFAARGPLSAALLEPIPVHDYYGPGSVLERFVAAGGQVLRLGANIDTVTVTHFAEYRANIPNKRRVRRRYVRADTGPQMVDSLDDTDGIVDWPYGDYFSRILLDYFGEDRAYVGPVGNCRAELLDAAPFVSFATQWLEQHLQ